MKLDQMPIDVLHAMQEVVTDTAPNADREALRRRGAGLYASFPAAEKRRPAPNAGPTLPMGPDDERRGGNVIVLDFARARSGR